MHISSFPYWLLYFANDENKEFWFCLKIYFDIIPFSGLMGIFEKRRFRKLMIFIMEFNLEDPKTWHGIDPKQNTAEDLYNKFGVDKNTINVTGHALALHLNDE